MSLRRWSIALVGITLALALAGGCPTTTPTNSGTTGNVADGQAKFAQTCATCHSAAGIAGFRSRITNNMGTVNSAMSAITLTDQEVADLQAYLATQ